MPVEESGQDAQAEVTEQPVEQAQVETQEKPPEEPQPPQWEAAELPEDYDEFGDPVAPTETPAEEKVVDEWDQATLENAQRYGIDEEAAKAFGSKDALDRALTMLDKQASALTKEQLKSAERARDEKGRFVAASEEVAPTEEAAPAEERPGQYEKYTLPIDTAEWDEDTVNVLNGLNDHYDSVIRRQQEQLAVQEQLLTVIGQKLLSESGRTTTDESQKLTTEMDAFFGGLGDEFAETFGKSPLRQLDPNSPQIVSRNQLLEEMKVLDIADGQAGRPQQGYRELAQRALRSLHYDKIQTTARKEVESKIKSRQSQQINRSSGRNGKPATQRDKALQRVEDIYRSKGFRLDDFQMEDVEV